MSSNVEMMEGCENEDNVDNKINENGNNNYGNLHTLECKLNVGNENNAKIIFTTLNVDKEPSRRKFCSDDEKSLQKSIQHFMEMYLLAKSTINTIGNYKYQNNSSVDEITTKKAKIAD